MESDDDLTVISSPVKSRETIAKHFEDIRKYAQQNGGEELCSQLLTLETELNSRVIKSKQLKLRQLTLFDCT
jgi:hypothetical protein